MKKETTQYFCDRCGKIIENKPKNPFVGALEEIRKKVGKTVPHYSGNVYLSCGEKLNYGGKDYCVFDLCEECGESLVKWYNDGCGK